MIKKIASAIYILRKIKHKINYVTALKLYDTLIASHLIYCNLAWGMTYKSYLDPIIKLQKRALRICLSMKSTKVCTKTPFVTANRLSVLNIYKKQSMCLIFDWYNNKRTFPESIYGLFTKTQQIHSHSTRQVDHLSLFTHSSSIVVRSNSLKIFAPFLWNSIPLNIKLLPSSFAFKKGYSIYLQNGDL